MVDGAVLPDARIEEIPACPTIELVISRPSKERLVDVERASGLTLPLEARSICIGDVSTLWLSPGRWLIRAPLQADHRRLLTLLNSVEAVSAVDLSDAWRGFLVSGVHARALMARCTSLDLDSFSVGRVTRSRLGDVAALYHQVGADPDRFEILVGQSFGEYAATWLSVVGKRLGELGL